MSTTSAAGSFVQVYIRENGGRYHVQPEHWDEFDAAYHHWVERRIDRVLSLTCNDGGPLLVAASRISEIVMSTPENRERDRELVEALKAESGFAE